MSEWNEARIKILRELWGLGRTCSQIASALGVGITRNAVISKAHRIGLPGRASPIKGAGTHLGHSKERAAPRAKSVKHQLYSETAKANRARKEAPKPQPMPVVTRPIEPLLMSTRDACAWPIGDPKEPDFHFCGGKPVMPGKPYPHEHCLRAYRSAEEAARERAGQTIAREAA